VPVRILDVGSDFERLMKAIEFERSRSQRSVPMAKSMSDLLREEEPCFGTREGIELDVSRADIEKAAQLLEAEEITKATLPLFVRAAPSMGRGFYRLLGVETGSEMERLHSKIAFKLLGVEPRTYFHSYEVQRIKREIPTLIYVFY
jgi:uncharacterized protein (UPF0216 family)